MNAYKEIIQGLEKNHLKVLEGTSVRSSDRSGDHACSHHPEQKNSIPEAWGIQMGLPQ